jgi:hypothetical protein
VKKWQDMAIFVATTWPQLHAMFDRFHYTAGCSLKAICAAPYFLISIDSACCQGRTNKEMKDLGFFSASWNFSEIFGSLKGDLVDNDSR